MRTIRAWMCVATLGSMLYAQEFTLPKKKQSTRAVKENCNDLLFEALKVSPSISKHNADVQQLGMDMVPSMLEGTFFSSMSKAELDACCKELESFYARQEKINVLLEEQCAVLRKLKGSCKAKK